MSRDQYTIGNEAGRPSDDTEKLCHRIYDVLLISPALKLLDDGKLYALIAAHDEAIRRECADRAIAWYRAGQIIPAHKESFAIKELRAAILGAEPEQDDGCEVHVFRGPATEAERMANIERKACAEPAKDDGKPEPGDLVISASSQAVQWNGLPDPWYWTAGAEVAMQDETIVVIRRAAEIKRLVEEARE